MDSNMEEEFFQFDKHKIWPVIYQEIRNEAAVRALDDSFSTVEAKRACNRNKNRYRDVSPYDHSRIILRRGETDYINANLIEVPEAHRKYILAQGPLPHTSGQFWQMVWENDTKAVIMLNKFVENGHKKCHEYFPLGEGNDDEDDIVFEDVGLKVSLLDEILSNYYVVRKLEIEDLQTGSTREVLHFNYVTWPDFGVPTSPHAFLNFLMAVRESGALNSDVGPAVVHCSAGIGRSGTFCLVDSSLIIIEKNQTMKNIDLRSMLLQMRTYRVGLIQTAEQLRFSYLAILEGGHRILANENSTLNVLTSYMEGSTSNDSNSNLPPPPPTRTTSLSPSHSTGRSPDSAPPPLPPRTGLPRSKDSSEELEKMDDSVNGSESDELIEDDDDVKQDEDMEEVDGQMDKAEEKEGDTTHNTHINGHEPSHINNASFSTEIRRRNRQERNKKTKDQVEKMKEKMKNHEMKKKRNSYLKPIAIGLTLLLGGYLLYKLYWSV